MTEKIKLGSNGNFGVKEGGTLAFNDENGVFKAIELASSRASGATYVAQSGLIADAEVGVPRIDYTNGVGELLLEPQSTNRVTYSEDFTNAIWVKSNVGSASAISVTSNYALSPDGSVNADRLVGSLNGGTTISDNTFIQFTDSGISNTSNSYYLKSNTGADQVMYIRASASVVAIVVTPEWQRFNLSVVGSTDYTQIGIRGGDYGGLTNSDSIDVLVWGAQREELSYPTSYIRTNGSSVTRIADAVTGNSSLGQVINSSEGVLYAEMSALANDGTFRFISLNDGSSNNALQIYWRTTANQVVVVVRQGGAEVMNESHILSNILDSNKYAIKYKNNDYALWINGVEVWTNTSTTTFSSNTLTDLSLESGAGTSFYRGRIKELKVYDTALTDAELQTLTTI